ncbi:MAG: hypothetical protein ACHREM_02230 [Polyangiales bacterium]
MITRGVRMHLAECAAECVPCTLAIEVAPAGAPPPAALAPLSKVERLLALKEHFRVAKDRVVAALYDPAVEIQDLAASPLMIVTAPVAAWERWFAPGSLLATRDDVRVLPEALFVSLGVRAKRLGQTGPTTEQARAAKHALLMRLRAGGEHPPEWVTGGIGITLDPMGGSAVALGVRTKADVARFPDPFFVDGVRVMIEAVGDIRALGASAAVSPATGSPLGRVQDAALRAFDRYMVDPRSGVRVPPRVAVTRALPDDPFAEVAKIDRMRERAARGDITAQREDASSCKSCGKYAWQLSTQMPVFDREAGTWHHPVCPRAHRIGYWRSESRPELPDPRTMVDTSWSPAERELVARYLDGNEEIAAYRGCSPCRICGIRNGNAERSDRRYIWPSGLSHYLRVHGVKPPAEFVKHVLRWTDMLQNGVGAMPVPASPAARDGGAAVLPNFRALLAEIDRRHRS